MSTPLARPSRLPPGPQAGASAHPTRQQLDELDALLQRMLALPVHGTDEEEASPPEARQPPPPAPPLEPPPLQGPLAPSRPRTPGSYPPSYMVVETAGPVLPDRSRAAAPPEPAVPAGPEPIQVALPDEEEAVEPPLPGGPYRLDPESEVGRGDLPPDPSALGTATADPEVWVPLRSSWQPSAQTWKPLADSWEQARTTTEADPRPPAPEHEPGVWGELAGVSSPAPVPPPQAEAPPRPAWVEQPAVPPVPPPPAHPPYSASGEPGEAVVGVWSGHEDRRRADGVPPTPPAPARAPARQTGPGDPAWALPLVWFNRAFDVCLAPAGPLGRWLQGRPGRAALGAVGLLCLAGALALAVADGIGWTW